MFWALAICLVFPRLCPPITNFKFLGEHVQSAPQNGWSTWILDAVLHRSRPLLRRYPPSFWGNNFIIIIDHSFWFGSNLKFWFRFEPESKWRCWISSGSWPLLLLQFPICLWYFYQSFSLWFHCAAWLAYPLVGCGETSGKERGKLNLGNV